jgi:hypothetical protein
MPGYGKRNEMYVPRPSEIVKTVEKRFVMPKITLAQIILILVIIAYAYTARKMNGVVVGSITLAIALLHAYDHLYLVKRGPERSLFSTGERYRADRSALHASLVKSLETYKCQSCN